MTEQESILVTIAKHEQRLRYCEDNTEATKSLAEAVQELALNMQTVLNSLEQTAKKIDDLERKSEEQDKGRLKEANDTRKTIRTVVITFIVSAVLTNLPAIIAGVYHIGG